MEKFSYLLEKLYPFLDNCQAQSQALAQIEGWVSFILNLSGYPLNKYEGAGIQNFLKPISKYQKHF